MNALDLFCCAGGATRGLQQAGFRVVGVDLLPQPNYCGDAFIQADALEYLRTANLDSFDFIWASPPCQRFTSMRHAPGTKAHQDLITPTRELLIRSGKPYCIENVVGAPLRNPFTLCGSMFGLKTPDGAELRRHRLFETSFWLLAPSCQHGQGPVIGIYGAHLRDRRRASGTNHKSGSNRPWEHRFIAMNIPAGSMTLAELSEAIPPVYARFIAEALGLLTQRTRNQAAYYRVWYARNREALLARQKAKRVPKPKKPKASEAEQRAKIRAAHKAWYAANPEKERARKALWRERNREKDLARKIAWYRANSEKAKAAVKAWCKLNPEKAKAHRAAWAKRKQAETRPGRR